VGRNNVVIDLVPPNTVFEPRLQQVDLRLSKRFTVGKTRFNAEPDLYNAFNENAVSSQTLRQARQGQRRCG
jgi:hypothetical protein